MEVMEVSVEVVEASMEGWLAFIEASIYFHNKK